MQALGFDEEHLVEAMIEFARHVLLWGGRIAYGGDLREKGFTERLLALAEQVSTDKLGVIRSYLAWPLHLALSQERVDRLTPIVTFERLPEVTGTVPDPSTALPPKGADNLKVWARNLTAMRALMDDNASARILLGGKSAGALGAMPGVVEEALSAIERKRPLYVLGAFGGASRLVWDALHGRPTPELDVDFQEHARPGYREFVEAYNVWAMDEGRAPIDYSAIRERLARTGVAGLNNGLTVEENGRLAATPHVAEMIALVFRGLRNVCAGTGGKP